MTETITPDARLVRTVFTVAWLSVLLGVGLELILVAVAAGAGAAGTWQPVIADLAQKISWASFVCIGLAFGKAAGTLRPQVTGILGLLAAPVGFTVARTTHKATEKVLGLASAVPPGGPSPYTLAAIKGLEYLLLGLTLGWLLKRAAHGAVSYIAAGLGAGILFGGFIVALMDWYAPKPLGAVALATRAVNEVLFPVGCSLALYAADHLAKRVKVVAA